LANNCSASGPIIRLKSRALAGRPELHKIEGLTHTEHRQRAFGQLRILVDNGAVHRAFPQSVGGADDHGGNVAGFQELVIADPSCRSRPVSSGGCSAPQ
jgi:acyl-CoA oxidase